MDTSVQLQGITRDMCLYQKKPEYFALVNKAHLSVCLFELERAGLVIEVLFQLLGNIPELTDF